MTIYEKLSQIQTKFKSKKSRFNSFGKYYFRSAEDILEATKPFLLELAITDGEGKITATSVVGVDLNQKGMQAPQQFGSASSYAKKYALGNLFLIDDTQDSDATNNHGKAKSKLTDIIAAKNFIASGGKIEAIKKKYQLTSAQEAELKTL
jgi:hypothetical protein